MAPEFKRFYREVGVTPDERGYAVLLDGRAIRTPRKISMLVPTRALAEALAAEWAEQKETVKPRTMPLMGLACTAIDHVRAEREKVLADMAAFGEHDLVCYWADAQPDLLNRQRVAWQPLLDWTALTFDAPLTVTRGVVPLTQAPASLAALRSALTRYDDMALSAVLAAIQAAGSLVIGLALAEGRFDAAAAFEASQLDETYQMELWGEDKEAAQRRAEIKAELDAAERFLALLKEVNG